MASSDYKNVATIMSFVKHSKRGYVADRSRRLKPPEPALGKLHAPIALQEYFPKGITRNGQTRYIQARRAP